jgi:diguanylate cyclase (GGDEF)-like protein
MPHVGQYDKKYLEKNEEKYIETLFLIGSFLGPFFVFVWDLLIPGKPLHLQIISWGIALLLPISFTLKYVSSYIKRNLSPIFYGVGYLITMYVVYLVYYNNFSKEYLLVLLLVVFYYTLTFEKLSSLIYYLITIYVFVTMAVFLRRINKNAYDDSGLVICICLFVFSFIAVFHLLKRNKDKRSLRDMALYDSLTRLPNRHFLNLHLDHVFKAAMLNGKSAALLLIDFNKFKNINDTMGHSFGDAVLKQASIEIKKCLQENDVLARFGSDVMVAVLENSGQEKARLTARKIVERFTQPLNVEGLRIDMTFSIGVSVYPNDSQDADSLIKHADIAMYEAKSRGRNKVAVFNREMFEAISRKVELENGLKSALKNGELSIVYQPQIDLVTGTIHGVEALLRFRHPELGMVSPGEFIPIAEETGLIVPIGEWVLKTACKQNMIWQQSGLPPITMAVNVSYRQLKTKGFILSVRDALSDSGLDSKYLELEITESVLRDAEELKSILEELKKMGIMLAIDDFGVGYSSFSMLQHLVFNNIKIDMSFIRNIPESSKAKTIVKTIIDMGKNLNCHITAEGVETEEQANYLKKYSCDIGQGYLLGRPLDVADLEKLLRCNFKK